MRDRENECCFTRLSVHCILYYLKMTYACYNVMYKFILKSTIIICLATFRFKLANSRVSNANDIVKTWLWLQVIDVKFYCDYLNIMQLSPRIHFRTWWSLCLVGINPVIRRGNDLRELRDVSYVIWIFTSVMVIFSHNHI